MNVDLITMDPATAKQKLRHYRRRTHADAEDVYRRCADAYAALAAGTPVIDLQQVFANCPVDDRNRPLLAIARADRKEVKFTADSFRSQFVFDSRAMRGSSRFRDNQTLRIPFSGDRFNRANDGYATVPMVPADVRPATGRLRDWFILWEVEQWAGRPIIDPPYDPFLLTHLGGTLYGVLAEWDLTEVERAVMREVLS